jgi:nitrate reductase NapD
MADLHIASCIARVRPETLPASAAAIEAVIGGPVSASDPIGKLVVLLEGPATGALLDQVERIRAIPGVLNIEMVYQHSEDESAMKELIP